MDYRKRLEAVYEKAYCNGSCAHYEECRSSSGCSGTHGHLFYQAKLGNDYGKVTPKILFVGKESTDDCGSMSKLAMEEPADVSRVPHKNTHYFGTIYTAACLLAGEIPPSANRADVLKYGDLRHDFCLTNYFKCAFKESALHHNVHANRKMKAYCYTILLEEIKALRPDVVVIQGKFTSSDLWDQLMFDTGRTPVKLFSSSDDKIGVMRYHYDDGAPFYVVWGYHPSYPRWGKTLDVFRQALRAIPVGSLNTVN